MLQIVVNLGACLEVRFDQMFGIIWKRHATIFLNDEKNLDSHVQTRKRIYVIES